MIKKEGREEPIGKFMEGRRHWGQHRMVEGSSMGSWLRDQYLGWNFDPLGIAYTREGGIFLTDERDTRLFFMNPERNTLNLINDNLPASGGRLDYNPVNDTVLWAKDGEVREYDEQGNVVNSLSTGQSGYAGHWAGKDTFVLVTHDDATYGHYAFKMDWEGNELWSFGTKGSSGSSLTELNKPFDIEQYGEASYLIADQKNHRLLVVGSDGTVNLVAMMTAPRQVEHVRPCSNILVSTTYYKEFLQWIFLVGSIGGDNPLLGGLGGHHANDLAAHPTKPFFLFPEHSGVLETSYRALGSHQQQPVEKYPLRDVSIGAGETVETRPQFVAFYDKFSVWSQGTQGIRHRPL